MPGKEGLYRIAIIIPVFNRRETTLRCLQQLKQVGMTAADFTVVVVDDGSTDGTAAAIEKDYPETVILRGDGNLWWSGAINHGLRYVLKDRYDYVLLLNDDLQLDEAFFSELCRITRLHPDALVSSIKLHRAASNEEKVIVAGFSVIGLLQQISNTYAGDRYDAHMFDDVIACEALTGAALMIPMDVIRRVGLFDVGNFPHNCGDIEFTRRANLAGYQCLVATRSKIYTESNSNYHDVYIIDSSRFDYLKNLFDYKKYNYGFRCLRKTSYLHKPFVPGTVIFLRRLLGLCRWVVLKMLISRNMLRYYADRHYKNVQSRTVK